MNLEAWTQCLMHEEGVITLSSYAVMMLVALSLIVSLAIGLSKSYSNEGVPSVGYGDFKLTGHKALTVFLVLLVGFGWFVVSFFGNVTDEYPKSKVGFDSPETKRTLDELRLEFQQETRSTIRLDTVSAKYAINGHHEGRCVADLFAGICRAHAGDLNCDIDPWSRVISVSQR